MCTAIIGGNEVELKEKAIEMSEVYRQNPKVEAIILAGSVARKLEDEHSDIELHILWSMPPEDFAYKPPTFLLLSLLIPLHFPL